MKPLIMQYNVRYDKMYYHNLRYSTEGGIVEIDFMGVPKIPDELEDRYDEEKNKFTADLNVEILAKLTIIDLKNNKTPYDNLTERQKAVYDCLEKGITKQTEIAKKVGCKQQYISKTFDLMRKKGVDIEKLLRKTPLQQL